MTSAAQQKPLRVYVPVSVDFSIEGKMYPKRLTWEDGREYEIDRVTDARPSFAAKAGSQGDRYTVRIGGQIRYLFFEHNAEYGKLVPGRWFVERKTP